MDITKQKSSIKYKTKLSRTFHKLINFNNGGVFKLKSKSKIPDEEKSLHSDENNKYIKARNRAVMEALISKLFASITSIKASYAELQMGLNPYNDEAVEVSDHSIVEEFKEISGLKRKFLKKELDFSPQVSLMLSEIQEQQSLMKTYQITIMKLETEFEDKDLEIGLCQKELENCVFSNHLLEKKLNSSGCLSTFENLQHFDQLNQTHFVQFLNFTIKPIKSFVKFLFHEMESSKWDLDFAVRFIVESDSVFPNPPLKIFAFESFVCKTMFDGFNDPNFSLQKSHSHNQPNKKHFLEKFLKLKSINPRNYLSQKPNSSFARFTRSKYVQLVHEKMEFSIFGNLNQRKVLISGGVPDSTLFDLFAEMSKRVWLLHCLAFSFGEVVEIFQVKKNCRFSEVYMESVTEKTEYFSFSLNDFNGGNVEDGAEQELRVWFTVVPGFKIGKTVVQSRVYLIPESG